ncbi:MAG: FAD-binding oxidoreductase [Ktedonobacteraceae bacterium]|nr:FAD-binding oxidoreductase [Ktedonobacteraceae bacterium]
MKITSQNSLLEETAVAEFKAQLRGTLLREGDTGYDAARALWNGMIDKRPALIARCTGTADVIACVNFARTHGIDLAIRSGGHNVAGNALCDGGLVIDLSQMRGVRVAPLARIARIQPGITLGDFDHETQVFGLATPLGMVSETGVAGLTLGGGVGWLSRKYGLSCDNLLSADIVTADGQLVTASPQKHADLFWGIRGGSGNFGVVTSFTFQLHPVGPTVLAGMALYPMEQAREVLHFYRAFAAAAPNELTTATLLRIAPPAPFLPRHVHRKPVVAIAVCYRGSLEEGERVLYPLLNFGTPVAKTISPIPYVNFQKMLDSASPDGLHYYARSDYLPELSDASIETMIHYAHRLTSPLTAILMVQLGGAVSRIDEHATAASNRNAAFILNMQALWQPQDEPSPHIQWTREFSSAMRPFSTGGTYVNMMSPDESEERVAAAYGSNYERLAALKSKYDPTNLFSVNHNIKPLRGSDRSFS